MFKPTEQECAPIPVHIIVDGCKLDPKWKHKFQQLTTIFGKVIQLIIFSVPVVIIQGSYRASTERQITKNLIISIQNINTCYVHVNVYTFTCPTCTHADAAIIPTVNRSNRSSIRTYGHECGTKHDGIRCWN